MITSNYFMTDFAFAVELKCPFVALAVDPMIVAVHLVHLIPTEAEFS